MYTYACCVLTIQGILIRFLLVAATNMEGEEPRKMPVEISAPMIFKRRMCISSIKNLILNGAHQYFDSMIYNCIIISLITIQLHFKLYLTPLFHF